MRVVVVVGTRPEAIKLVPLILALRESAVYEPVVISSGQHHAMVREVLGLAGITPDVDLWVGCGHSRLNERVAALMRRFEDFCNERSPIATASVRDREEVAARPLPGIVLVHGDTSSAIAAALAAFHLRIPVGHVEAGLRTGGCNFTPFPEELNRQLISCIACDPLRADGRRTSENLVREGIPVGQIFVTGNTGIDALQWAAALDVQFDDPLLPTCTTATGAIVVVTAHRRENWGGGLGGIAEGVAPARRRAARRPLRGAAAPEPARARGARAARSTGVENVLVTEPLGYARFATTAAARRTS